ncbi:hypothetical protein [Hymenobacter psychrotolerans]|uniref:Uncharacterized protein n=1 Tax=Hymenobacter psychrotolerans DSM 18569 TaxID=1121959 RepID=A0A1M6Y5Q6_9BACT|nr:hypothetical protein [Hymenobacter psychrotolerans]SHL13551.1 hypothetical protein SAMN02746009_02196 [Hymenobacter psychrotolerans DSM 18569]
MSSFRISPLFARLAAPVVLGGLLITACNDDDDRVPPDPAPLPEVVAFTQPNLYPEGVQYDAQNSRFL